MWRDSETGQAFCKFQLLVNSLCSCVHTTLSTLTLWVVLTRCHKKAAFQLIPGGFCYYTSVGCDYEFTFFLFFGVEGFGFPLNEIILTTRGSVGVELSLGKGANDRSESAGASANKSLHVGNCKLVSNFNELFCAEWHSLFLHCQQNLLLLIKMTFKTERYETQWR